MDSMNLTTEEMLDLGERREKPFVSYDELNPLQTDALQTLQDLWIIGGAQIKPTPELADLITTANDFFFFTCPDKRLYYIDLDLKSGSEQPNPEIRIRDTALFTSVSYSLLWETPQNAPYQILYIFSPAGIWTITLNSKRELVSAWHILTFPNEMFDSSRNFTSEVM